MLILSRRQANPLILLGATVCYVQVEDDVIGGIALGCRPLCDSRASWSFAEQYGVAAYHPCGKRGLPGSGGIIVGPRSRYLRRNPALQEQLNRRSRREKGRLTVPA